MNNPPDMPATSVNASINDQIPLSRSVHTIEFVSNTFSSDNP